MILEHKRTSDHVVSPVFYDVDPSDVRKQSGSVAMAFARHETKQSPEKLIQWRAALTEVSNLAGMVLQDQADRHESNFIKKIVNVIEAKLINPTPFSVTPYLIGFDHQVNTINLWLQDKYSDVGQCRILVLKGVGGVGKTTIAKVVYNSNFERFEASSFLESIREISEQPNGLVQLQRQFLSNILNGRKLKIHSVSEGLKKIQDHVSSKSVLLVLDDVDHTDQLDALLGMEGYFCSRSKIIITTRRAGLLKLYNNVKEYPIETLNPPQSLELFSWHAFGWICPWYSYTELSKRVVEHTEGLPLALQILGSSLRGQMVDVWESQLQKLEAIPSNEILNRLRISYDSLEDNHDKNLFLHIACFFIGKSKDVIIRLLDECGFYTIVGIQNLIDRCLVTIDRDNKVRMHKMIRDMGRGIVHLESRYPEKRSRIWHHKDSLSVLRKKNGSETIEGLVLDTHKLALETNAFTRMRGLIFLQLSGVDVTGSYEAFPERLRWLCWLEFPSSFIPISFPLRSLVVLEMQYSKLRQFSKGSKSFPSLKYLDLSHSKDLTEIGDFLMLPNLEKLIIEDCANLLKVHKSIVNLEKLDYLNMRDCKKIRKLPKNINKLKLLEVLIISGCSSLTKFPVEIGMMESLKALEANKISIGRLLAPIGKVKLWPGKSVNNFWFPSGIVQLRLRNCNLCDDIFPRDFGNLASLRYMDLGGNAISRLPDCIRNLSGLDCLDFGFCKNLKSLEGLPGVSEAIDATFCESLEKITFQSISCMPKKIEMFNFRSKLREIQFWFKIVSIEDEKEMIKILGLCNLECKEKIRMCTPDLFDGWNTDRPIQGLYEYGIFSTFVPENRPEFVRQFSYSNDVFQQSITVPVHPNLRIRGVNIYVNFMIGLKPLLITTSPIVVMVANATKNLTWIYVPSCDGKSRNSIAWLSHWKFGDQLEGGDEVIVYSFSPDNWVEVKELGVQIVHEEEKQSAEDNFAENGHDRDSVNDVIGGDLSELYQVWPGVYFFCGGPILHRRQLYVDWLMQWPAIMDRQHKGGNLTRRPPWVNAFP